MQFSTLFIAVFAAAGALAAPAPNEGAGQPIAPRQNGTEPGIGDIPGVNNPTGQNDLCGFSKDICRPGRGFADCDAQCKTCAGKYGNYSYGRCCGQTSL